MLSVGYKKCFKFICSQHLNWWRLLALLTFQILYASYDSIVAFSHAMFASLIIIHADTPWEHSMFGVHSNRCSGEMWFQFNLLLLFIDDSIEWYRVELEKIFPENENHILTKNLNITWAISLYTCSIVFSPFWRKTTKQNSSSIAVSEIWNILF